MSNFSINFSSPLFLLLLIPLVVLTFIPYFRLSKKFRKTRNRIISLVMHLTVVCLSLFVLSGMTFNYTIPNEKNEIILVVDVSDTQKTAEEARNEFVSTVLRQSRYDSYKVGVVTFGFDCVYAVPLTDDVESVYDAYLSSSSPDTSATNISDALLYAKSLFENPETSKIVLITDAKETDKNATEVIRTVSAGGTKVDVAFVPSSYDKGDVGIVGVTLPDYHVALEEEFNIVVDIASDREGQATVKISDNDVNVESSEQTIDFRSGSSSVTLKHKFSSSGLHELVFSLTSSTSTIEENDEYRSYFYLSVFNKVLMIGRNDGECEPLKNLLVGEKDYEVTVQNILESDFFADANVDKLREYDQIILNNVAYSDMPEGFDGVLYEYVYTYGGGLLTVGGQDETGNAHSYVRSDMIGTTYQQILPVQAIDYTPPLGVVVIIDRSGSMGTIDNVSGRSYLEWATEGAKSCLNAMSERDYMGIVTLDTNQAVVLPLTPRTQESKILAAIESVNVPNGGTVLPGAIEKAGEMLRSEKNIDKRHIILVTDGIVNEKETYEDIIKQNYENEAASITMSVVLVGSKEGSTPAQDMKDAAEAGHGRLYVVSDTSKLVMLMREDLRVPEITEVNMEKFNPVVYDATSSVLSGVGFGNGEDGGLKMNVTLDGFYGVKIKKNANLILTGEYNVPLYAQWKFGKGSVGSFMCDLSGNWSADFMSDDNGVRFIKNVVGTLMPTESIRPKEIETRFSEQNYTNRLDVYANLGEGETISGRISEVNGGGEKSLNTLIGEKDADFDSSFYVSMPFAAGNNYTRCDFVVKRSGVYKITLEKRSADGNIIATEEFYKAFSYSLEYDVFGTDEEELIKKVAVLAERGKGQVIKDLEDPEEIFGTFVTELLRSFDPRTLFLVIAIVLFLIDVAVRKFKFKWIHEIIRERKEKKNGNRI